MPFKISHSKCKKWSENEFLKTDILVTSPYSNHKKNISKKLKVEGSKHPADKQIWIRRNMLKIIKIIAKFGYNTIYDLYNKDETVQIDYSI